MSETKKMTRTHIFSVIVALYPLLSVYKSPVPGVDLATIVLVVFALANLRFTICRDEMNIIILYIIFQTPFAVMIADGTDVAISTIIVRYGKIVLSLLLVFSLGIRQKYYDEEITFRAIKIVVFICTLFITIQRLAYFLGIVISNPLLRFVTNEAYDVTVNYIAGKLYRPSGFFLEPAHMAVYSLPFLCYVLLKKDSIKDAIIASIGIIFTGSGIGLVSMALVYVAYFLIRFKKYFLRTVLLIIAFAVIAVFLGRTKFIQQVIMRFTTDNVAYGGNALKARIGDGYELFYSLPLQRKIIGKGYGNVPPGVYINGLSYILYTLGFFGTGLYAYVLVRSIISGEVWKKIGLALIAGMMVYSQIFTPSYLIFFFCIYSVHYYSAHRVQ